MILILFFKFTLHGNDLHCRLTSMAIQFTIRTARTNPS